jgi:hypothetical protein
MNFRLRYFSRHFFLSCLLALITLVVVFVFWYPSPLASATGVTSVFLILLGVDVALGPLLTFLVAKEGKKSLRFDLAVIVVLQLAAFLYGMSVVAAGRPVWIVFSKDRFDLVQAYEIEQKNIEQAEAQFQQPGWFGPKWIAARLPTDTDELNDLMFESVAGGADLPYRPELYVEYQSEIEAIEARSFPLAELSKVNPENEVQQVLARWPEATAYLPLMARKQEMTVLINKKSGKVITIVSLKPW